jgi:K+-transporting ATPase KdpF subunit
MNAMYLIALVMTLGLFGYLLVALFKPELF